MECYVGIDLGSTTTKAVYIDSNERILGRGITNSRSNYVVACQVAREEAEINARFLMLEDRLKKAKSFAKPGMEKTLTSLMAWISAKFALAQHLRQLHALKTECATVLDLRPEPKESKIPYAGALERIFSQLDSSSDALFQPGQISKSDFFRDIASSLFLKEAETVAKETSLSFDRIIGLYDKAILRVENSSFASFYPEYMEFAKTETLKIKEFSNYKDEIQDSINFAKDFAFNVVASVGTGYGRLTLPFPKEQIRSEILCHGRGAHFMFPGTRTVLDIGGQDTKAIQVDSHGIVTSFQMNDRCAAGCGRYLGYIADEMNIGVHQLGPMAATSQKPTKINSTCTVFAGAELRERLSLGEKREDILAGLHRAIILRAMSLIARSGGVVSEFTFTGGVAKNEAATGVLKGLIEENYGKVKMNISPDSIFTGCLGAALYAKRDRQESA